MNLYPETIISNRGLTEGRVVTEIRNHPFIKRDGYWGFSEEIVHFRVIEVGRSEYKCKYLDTEDQDEFYWPFWDKQPNYGFWINGSSTVSYYASQAIGEDASSL